MIKVRKLILFSLLFSLFFDFLFFNYNVIFLNITLMRLIIFSLFFYIILYFLSHKLIINKKVLYIFFFMILWFSYGFIQLFWVKEFNPALKELYYFLVFIFLMVILVFFIKKQTDFYFVGKIIWFFTIILIFISMIEFITNFHLPVSRYVIEERLIQMNIKRATTIFYNENGFSLYLNLVFPIFLVYGLKNKSLIFSFINLSSILFIIYIIYKNDSRLATITILVQLFIFIVLNTKNIKKLIFIYMPIILTPLIVFWINIFSFLNTITIQINNKSGSAFIRLNLYMNGLYALYKSNFLGVGPSGYQNNIYSKLFYTKDILDPHSWWIEILTNYGLFIFVFYVFMCIYILIKLYNYYIESKNKIPEILFLSWIGLIIGGQGTGVLFYFWPMWFLLGISLSFINLSSFNKEY